MVLAKYINRSFGAQPQEQEWHVSSGLRKEELGKDVVGVFNYEPLVMRIERR